MIDYYYYYYYCHQKNYYENYFHYFHVADDATDVDDFVVADYDNHEAVADNGDDVAAVPYEVNFVYLNDCVVAAAIDVVEFWDLSDVVVDLYLKQQHLHVIEVVVVAETVKMVLVYFVVVVDQKIPKYQ